MKDKSTLILILIIILLGGILRVTKLDYQSLWNDELSSLTRVDESSLREVIEASKEDVHPALYYSLLYLWQSAFGNSSFSVRLLSVIFGTLSILAIFFLGKTLYSEREALISAFILSISYFGIYYSQEVRSYSLLLLLSICSYLFFIKIQPHPPQPHHPPPHPSHPPLSGNRRSLYYIFYILCTTLLIYTHYFGILVLVSQFVLILSAWRQKKDKDYFKILFSQVGITLLYLPQIAIMKSKMNIAETWIKKPHFDFFLHYFYEYWGKNEIFFLLALLCIFCFFYFRKKEELSETLLLVIWVTVPLILAYGRSIFSTPILTSRNTIIILPPLIMMTARGITKNEDLLVPLLVAVSIAGLCSLFITNDYYYRVTKQQFREVADVVLEAKAVQDQSLVIACAWNTNYFDYFFKQAHSPLRVSGIYDEKEDIPALDALVQKSQKKYLWYLIGHKYPSQEFLQYLEKRYKLMGTRQFNGSSFFLFAL